MIPLISSPVQAPERLTIVLNKIDLAINSEKENSLFGFMIWKKSLRHVYSTHRKRLINSTTDSKTRKRTNIKIIAYLVCWKKFIKASNKTETKENF